MDEGTFCLSCSQRRGKPRHAEMELLHLQHRNAILGRPSRVEPSTEIDGQRTLCILQKYLQ